MGYLARGGPSASPSHGFRATRRRRAPSPPSKSPTRTVRFGPTRTCGAARPCCAQTRSSAAGGALPATSWRTTRTGTPLDWFRSGWSETEHCRVGGVPRRDRGRRDVRLQGKVQLEWEAADHARLVLNAYVVRYDLELHSNFTYALEDPSSGDGIVQRDDRLYGGGHLAYEHVVDPGFPATLRGGVDWRLDDARVRLGRQTRRRSIGALSDDDVRVYSVAPYLEIIASPLPWVRLEGGLRHERIAFDVDSRIHGTRGSGDDALWLPKANVVLSPFAGSSPWPASHPALRELELFLHAGVGFHSNDPRSGLLDERILSSARGAEVGVRTRLAGRAEVAASVFWLSLEDELVFVGDAGTTESAGSSRRLGVELAASLELAEWLGVRADVSYTSARTSAGPRRPGASTRREGLPRRRSRALARGALGAIAGRAIRPPMHRAASACPTTRSSTFGVRYRRDPWEVGVRIENLTDREWRSSEFFYSSCAPGEIGSAGRMPDRGGRPGDRRPTLHAGKPPPLRRLGALGRSERDGSQVTVTVTEP